MKAGWQIKTLREVLRIEIESTHKVEHNTIVNNLKEEKLP